IPAPLASPSANERFKGRFRAFFWIAIVLATGVHFGALTLWPAITVGDVSFRAEELVAIELPPEIEIPAPPAHIVRPAAPVIAPVDVPEDLTIAPTTFEHNPVSELPPPPTRTATAVAEEALEAGPVFTPYTVAPEILNRSEIARALVESYPPLLRSA